VPALFQTHPELDLGIVLAAVQAVEVGAPSPGTIEGHSRIRQLPLCGRSLHGQGRPRTTTSSSAITAGSARRSQRAVFAAQLWNHQHSDPLRVVMFNIDTDRAEMSRRKYCAALT